MEEQRIMRNVLIAYSRRNSRVGYVQGQNFIVRAILDLIKEEEDTFWVFCYVIEECFSVSYFINLKNLMLDSLIFRILLKSIDPKLMVKIQSIQDFDLDLLTFKWFLSLYSDTSLSSGHVKMIWDMLILGDRLIYMKAGLKILEKMSSSILKCNDISEMYQLFGKMHESMGNSTPQSFIKEVNKMYMNERILGILRISNQSKRQRLDKLKDLATKETPSMRRRLNSPCNGRNVLCKDSLKTEEDMNVECFTFCTGNIVKNRIFNYFSEQNDFWQENKKRKKVDLKEEDMMIHRQKHMCIKGQMIKAYEDYEIELCKEDIINIDQQKIIFSDLNEFIIESKFHFDAKERNNDHPDENSEDEEDTKTVRKGSNRYFRQPHNQ